MNQVGGKTLLVVCLALALGACQQTTAPEDPGTPPGSPTPPVDPPAEVAVSGTLAGWDDGEAFVTFPGGGLSFTVNFDSSSDEVTFDDLEILPPLFQGTVAADGSFSVDLPEPDASELTPLGCTADGPNVAAVGVAVASTVETPTVGSEVIGIYTYADAGTVERRAGWLYVAEPYEAEVTCTPTGEGEGEAGTARIDLTLEAGWNEVVSTVEGSGTVLTSEPIPDTFEWVNAFSSED